MEGNGIKNLKRVRVKWLRNTHAIYTRSRLVSRSGHAHCTSSLPLPGIACNKRRSCWRGYSPWRWPSGDPVRLAGSPCFGLTQDGGRNWRRLPPRRSRTSPIWSDSLGTTASVWRSPQNIESTLRLTHLNSRKLRRNGFGVVDLGEVWLSLVVFLYILYCFCEVL